MNRKWMMTAVALLPWLVLLAMLPLAALARAGGGQNYGGSGSGGFDSGGDDFGSGLFSLWPLLFLGHGTGFGTVLIIFILYSMYRRYMRSQGSTMGPMREAWSPTLSGGLTNDDARGPIAVAPRMQTASPDEIAAGIAAIKAHDRNFDETAFLGRAQTCFFKLQQAWQARNQDIARDCETDALYERHKIQTDQLIANHQINMLDNIVIGHAAIVGVNAGHPYDSIVVAISASMSDYTVDENTKQVVSGNQFQRTFTERWTYIRRADATSTVGQTQLASSCPSCGAPLSLQNGRCTYCGAFVKTSSSDWVVDSIEQQ
ncbi:MAG TPA: TIM44-like domain-containing protein [Candidatus Acidoferrales bacterium]|nr:TIM44-like domain-containing protein [Candidatus Acidoferrales bacterium]